MTDGVRRWWIAGIGLLFVIAWLGGASAVESETFGMAPHPEQVNGVERRTFAIPLEQGATFEDSVRVYNRTDQPLTLALYPADAEAGVDGTISIGFRGSRPSGVGAWINLSQREVALPPRGEVVVPFRVDVRSTEPSPDLGAIVAENNERGIAAELAQRLHVVVRTAPANAATTSIRVRPLLLRSPWVIIAILGLVAALVIVWLGARRARRPKDVVLDREEAAESKKEVTPASSRPVLRRLGEPDQSEGVARRRRSAAGPVEAQRPALLEEEREPDSRPLLDDMLVEVDEPPSDVAMPSPGRAPQKKASHRPKKAQSKEKRRRKPAPAAGREPQGAGARKYIPLDDL